VRVRADVLATLVVAACVSAWCTWWLAVDQTGGIDTTSAKVHALNLPTDGTLITQSFRAAPGGTGALCVLVGNTSDRERQLLLQVHADDSGRRSHLVQRSVLTVPPRSQDCLGVSRMPPATTPDTTLWLALRALSAESSSGVQVFSTDDDVAALGRLIVGDQERWGDLAFEAAGPMTTRWHVGWPRPLFKPASRPGVGLMVFGVLMVSMAAVWTASLAMAWSGRATAAIILLVPMSVLALQALSTPPSKANPPTWSGSGRTLLDTLPEATMRTSSGSLADGFALVTSDIGSAKHRALFALPTSNVQWRVNVTEPTSLDTAVALRQEAWTHAGDGVTFTITVSQGTTNDILWQGHIDPYANPGSRRWQDVTVRLDRYVGKEIVLSLSTGPGPSQNAVLDAAMWREPVLRKSVVR
jgi:hypothetical protein